MIALAMWRTSFGGVNDFGLGSAIAVFLFLLVIPVAGAQHPALPEGGLMATAGQSSVEPRGRRPDERRRAKLLRGLARAR